MPLLSAIVGALSLGCRDAPAPECTPLACASWRSPAPGVPLPGPSSSKVERSAWTLDASKLAGIFPPAWKRGEQWKIRFHGAEIGMRTGAPSEPSRRWADGTFRVEAVPGPANDLYVVRFESKSEFVGSDTRLEIRAADFSTAKVQRGSASEYVGAGPYVTAKAPILGFPMVPPGLQSPMFFDPGTDEYAMQAWQRISVEPDGHLEITLVAREREGLRYERLVGTWRRGDPWWSTLKCFSPASASTVFESERTAITEIETCAVELVR